MFKKNGIWLQSPFLLKVAGTWKVPTTSVKTENGWKLDPSNVNLNKGSLTIGLIDSSSVISLTMTNSPLRRVVTAEILVNDVVVSTINSTNFDNSTPITIPAGNNRQVRFKGVIDPINAFTFNANFVIKSIDSISDTDYIHRFYPTLNSSALVSVPENLPPSVTSLAACFSNCSNFTGTGLAKWKTTNVTNMSGLAFLLTKFNPDLSEWDVSNVTVFDHCFYGASIFNRSLAKWNTGKATTMYMMFYNTTSFNQNISGWDVGKVTFWSAFSGNSALSVANTPPKFR